MNRREFLPIVLGAAARVGWMGPLAKIAPPLDVLMLL